MSEVSRTISDGNQIGSLISWVSEMTEKGLRSGPVVVTLGRPKRSHDQNKLMWAMLTDISQQIEWVVDGERRKMSPDEWKDLLTASLKRQSMAPGIDGGMVVLGMRTSKMSKEQFSELVELIAAFGNERGVVWSDDSYDT